jgi:MFS family permease
MLIIPVGGIMGAILGGYLSDKWHSYHIGGKAFLMAASQLLGVPFITAFFLVESWKVALVLLFPAFVFAEMWYGPSAAIAQDLTPPAMRGFSSAVYFIVTSVGALAPLIVG